MSEHTPPPWKIYDDIDPFHIKIKGTRSDIGAAHVADVLFPTNAEFLLKAVNNHDLLVQAIKDIKQATLEGRVCDDVAWFSTIETLHDFCESVLDRVGVGKER